MSLIKAKMPLLARHEGVWTGTARMVTPDLTLIQAQDFILTIDFPDDDQDGRTYRQTNINLAEDGTQTRMSYIALLEPDAAPAMARFEGAISGAVTELDDHTLYVTFGLPGVPGLGFELITLSSDGAQRQRTWHLFNADGSRTVGVIDEQRVD